MIIDKSKEWWLGRADAEGDDPVGAGRALTNKEKNELFEKLSPSEKRVAIAMDVLRLVTEKKIETRTGNWIGTKAEDGFTNGVADSTVPDDKPLDELLPETEQCTGCALGAVFYATVMCANKLTVGDLRKIIVGPDHDRNALTMRGVPAFMDYLEQYFDREQLELIESAFERGEGFFPSGKGLRWQPSLTCKKPDERVRVIMNNIIDNDGEFVAEGLLDWSRP